MLLGQHSRRGEHTDLLLVNHGLERRPQGDLRLPVSDVSAYQAIHGTGLLHVRSHFLDDLQLGRAFLHTEKRPANSRLQWSSGEKANPCETWRLAATSINFPAISRITAWVFFLVRVHPVPPSLSIFGEP